MGLRVVLADDHRLIREGLKAFLATRGIESGGTDDKAHAMLQAGLQVGKGGNRPREIDQDIGRGQPAEIGADRDARFFAEELAAIAAQIRAVGTIERNREFQTRSFLHRLDQRVAHLAAAPRDGEFERH